MRHIEKSLEVLARFWAGIRGWARKHKYIAIGIIGTISWALFELFVTPFLALLVSFTYSVGCSYLYPDSSVTGSRLSAYLYNEVCDQKAPDAVQLQKISESNRLYTIASTTQDFLQNVPENKNRIIKAYEEVCEYDDSLPRCYEAREVIKRLEKPEYEISDTGLLCDLEARRPPADHNSLHNTFFDSNSEKNEQGSSKPKKYSFQIDPSKAIPACERAIEDYPDKPEYKYQLARSYHSNRSYKKAKEYYKMATEQDYGPAYSALGNLYGGGDLGEADTTEAIKWFRLGHEKRHFEPTLALGKYLQYGYGVDEVNRDKALSLYLEVYNKKSPEAAIRLGHFYREGFAGSDKKQTAYNYYQDAANWGDVSGYLQMADMLLSGDLSPISDEQDKNAFEIIKNVIEVDQNPWARHFMGRMYEYGRGVAQNNETALDYYKEALNRKYAYSAIKIGDAYRFGRLGLEKNEFKSSAYYNQAISLGDSDGFSKKASSLIHGSHYPVTDERDRLAFDEVAKAISKDKNPWARNFRAWMYLNGRGVERNVVFAKNEFEKLLSEINYGGAALNLGVIYRDGLGVDRDIEKAKEYFDRAFELGVAKAKVYKAMLSINGQDGDIAKEKDEKAFEQVREAADKNDAYALSDLGWLYDMGIGVNSDKKEAFKYYLKGHKLYNSTATKNLGDFYNLGLGGLDIDYKKAVEYYKEAIRRDNFDGYPKIAILLFDGKIFANDLGEIIYKKPANLSEEAIKGQADRLAFKVLNDGHIWNKKNNWIMNRIAWAYENGRGISQNNRKAIEFYEKATGNGNLNSINRLAEAYYTGDLGEQDWDKSLFYLKEAASRNDEKALLALSYIYSGYEFWFENQKLNLKNCDLAENYFIKLLDVLPRSRNINIDYNFTFNNFINSEYSQEADICDNAFKLSQKSITQLQQFIIDNKFSNNIYAFRYLVTHSSELIGNSQIYKEEIPKEIISTLSWAKNTLQSNEFRERYESHCLMANIDILLGKYEQAFENYSNALRHNSFKKQAIQSCHFESLDLIGIKNLKDRQKEDYKNFLEDAWRHSDLLSKYDKNYFLLRLYIIGSDLIREKDIGNIDIDQYSNILKSNLAMNVLAKKESTIIDDWAGYEIADQLINGQNDTFFILKENIGNGKTNFWKGVQRVMKNVCIYEGKDDGKVGPETISSLHSAYNLWKNYYGAVENNEAGIERPFSESWRSSRSCY